MPEDDRIEQRMALLRRLPPEQRERVLAAIRPLGAAGRGMSGSERVNTILSVPQTERFVQTLSTFELFSVVHEIGLRDSGDLLRLAAGPQLRQLLDVDCWRHDRLDLKQLSLWLASLEANADEAMDRLLQALDDADLVLLLLRVARVHDASELEDDEPGRRPVRVPPGVAALPSPDGQFVLLIPESSAFAEHVPLLLDRLFALDMRRARQILQACRFELPAPLEEDAYRWRNARLADTGFVPHEEAVEIEAPLAHIDLPPAPAGPSPAAPVASAPAARAAGVAPAPPPDAAALALTAGDFAEGRLAPQDRLSLLLQSDRVDEPTRRRFREGMAGVLLRRMIVGGARVDDGSPLQDVADHVLRVVNLGLEWSAAAHPEAAEERLAEQEPKTLYRLGATVVARVRRRAQSVARRAGWTVGLQPFDSPLAERLEALVADPPWLLAADGAPLAAGPEPTRGKRKPTAGAAARRPLLSLADVRAAEALLAEAEALLGFFEQIYGFAPNTLLAGALAALPEDERRFVRFSALFLTGLANRLLDRPGLAPLLPGDVAHFVDLVLSEGQPRSVRAGVLAEVLAQVDALPDRLGLGPETRRTLGAFVTDTLRQFADEVGGLPAGTAIDPRFLGHVLLVRATAP